MKKVVLFLLLLLFALPLTPPGDFYQYRSIASIQSGSCFQSLSNLLEESSDRRILKHMKTAKITTLKRIEGMRATHSYIATFGGLSDIRAVFKPQLLAKHSEHFRLSNSGAEELAYLIDRKFGFDLVPPTTIRKNVEVNGELRWGSVQHYVGNLPSVDKIASKMGYMGDHAWKNLSAITRLKDHNAVNKLSFFDYLIENGDRHTGNALLTYSGKLIAIDHGACFTGVGNHMKTFAQRRMQIDTFLDTKNGREILQKLQELDFEEFHTFLTEHISEADAKRVIYRIQGILEREQLKEQFNLGLEFRDYRFENDILKILEEGDYEEPLEELADAIKIDDEVSTIFYDTLSKYESDISAVHMIRKKKLKDFIKNLKQSYENFQ